MYTPLEEQEHIQDVVCASVKVPSSPSGKGKGKGEGGSVGGSSGAWKQTTTTTANKDDGLCGIATIPYQYYSRFDEPPQSNVNWALTQIATAAAAEALRRPGVAPDRYAIMAQTATRRFFAQRHMGSNTAESVQYRKQLADDLTAKKDIILY